MPTPTYATTLAEAIAHALQRRAAQLRRQRNNFRLQLEVIEGTRKRRKSDPDHLPSRRHVLNEMRWRTESIDQLETAAGNLAGPADPDLPDLATVLRFEPQLRRIPRAERCRTVRVWLSPQTARTWAYQDMIPASIRLTCSYRAEPDQVVISDLQQHEHARMYLPPARLHVTEWSDVLLYDRLRHAGNNAADAAELLGYLSPTFAGTTSSAPASP